MGDGFFCPSFFLILDFDDVILLRFRVHPDDPFVINMKTVFVFGAEEIPDLILIIVLLDAVDDSAYFCMMVTKQCPDVFFGMMTVGIDPYIEAGFLKSPY